MVPIYFTLSPQLSLIIIPDTQAHLDGHTIITRTYHIHKKDESLSREFYRNLEILGINHNDEPSYMGYLTFDVPGRIYSYTRDGDLTLSSDEIEELIEQLNEVRENPGMWPRQEE
ncbi:hypothetical protein AAFN85_25660 [Mucilaginibacter sp. CAU 1740]|uniref:hypothetical protein n=1 Tax=Mucilaginibacter sp. CAU 1740 TaxID=3140365 RepID=UPI00325B1BAD